MNNKQWVYNFNNRIKFLTLFWVAVSYVGPLSAGLVVSEETKLNRKLLMQSYQISKTESVNSMSQGANYFTDSENLAFVALIEAQNKLLKPNLKWYYQLEKKEKRKSFDTCLHKIRKEARRQDQLWKSADKMKYCVASQLDARMELANIKRQRDIIKYINARQIKAQDMVKECTLAYRQALDNRSKPLPKQIKHPLAKHDIDLHSLKNWLLFDDFDKIDASSFTKVTRIKASDVMKSLVGKKCPGDMVFWIDPKL